MRLFFIALVCARMTGALAAPDISSILQKLSEHSAAAVQLEARNAFAYDRSSRVDYLNEDDGLRKQVIRLYKVAPENGQLVTRLISINDRPPAAKEEQKKSSGRQAADTSRSLALSHDLLARYDFTYTGETRLDDRPAWMLRFHPREGLESEGVFDKIVNAMSGILWVDMEDGQLAKAEIFLARKVSFFGGFAGAIERMNVTIVQRRMEPNVWLNESAFVDFADRKLLSAVRFRSYESCTGFHKALPAPASPPTSDPIAIGSPGR